MASLVNENNGQLKITNFSLPRKHQDKIPHEGIIQEDNQLKLSVFKTPKWDIEVEYIGDINKLYWKLVAKVESGSGKPKAVDNGDKEKIEYTNISAGSNNTHCFSFVHLLLYCALTRHTPCLLLLRRRSCFLCSLLFFLFLACQGG